MRALVVTVLAAGSALAQTEDFGKAYSFAERKPATKVEQVIDRVLPSLVKIHGASGLSTISAYATGVIVSKQGHVLALDQIMIQKDRTRVVLYDGSVHQATLLPEEPRLKVRLLKIDPTLVRGELQPLWPPAANEGTFRTGQFVVSIGNAFRLARMSSSRRCSAGACGMLTSDCVMPTYTRRPLNAQ